MGNYIMVIDEGTTGTRGIIFDRKFNIVAQEYQEITQYTPENDRVEHDAQEIFEKSVAVCQGAMEKKWSDIGGYCLYRNYESEKYLCGLG